MFDVWNKYQNVGIGEILFTVVPNDIKGIIERVTISVQNSGKVKEGQNVIIKVDNYPYQEWGSLRGTIVNISGVPKQGESIYTIFIDVGSLETSFNKSLALNKKCKGLLKLLLKNLPYSNASFINYENY